MLKIPYDPMNNEIFWEQISQIPGYPAGVAHPIRKMVFESGALLKIPDLLRSIEVETDIPVLVVMDPTVMFRGSEELKPLVLSALKNAGYAVDNLILETDATGQVHTDMPHVEAVRKMLRPGLAVLSVGSGTVTDITKHACYLFEQQTGHRIPLAFFQTANSVSAFTSNMAPTFLDGVKRTLDSRYPDLLICDLETLASAPREMTSAGVGDLLAAFVSFPDWYLASTLGMDSSYTEFPSRLIGPLDDVLLEHAHAIRAGTLEGMSVLARLISLGGLAMSLAHATTPMSGYEHVMSHILDLQAEQNGAPLAQHGTQVSLTTIIACETYDRFLHRFDPAQVQLEHCYPSEQEMRERVLSTFLTIDPSGKAGEHCWDDYRLKLERWNDNRGRFQMFLDHWSAIRPEIVRQTRPARRALQILKAIDAPLCFEQLVPPATQEQVKFAFMNAPLMRKRLTIGDLLIFLGWDREQMWKEIWTTTQTEI